jgi:hypothetical protein
MGEFTVIADRSIARDFPEGMLYKISQMNGKGGPVFLKGGEACGIGRLDPETDWTPAIYFDQKNVSRAHCLAYVDNQTRKLYLVGLSLRGTFANTGYKIEDCSTKTMFPGGSVMPVSNLITSLRAGILTVKDLNGNAMTPKAIEFLIKAVENKYAIGSNGLPTGELEPRNQIARIDVNFYYPRTPERGVIPANEAKFRLTDKESSLEIIIQPKS